MYKVLIERDWAKFRHSLNPHEIRMIEKQYKIFIDHRIQWNMYEGRTVI